VVRPGNKRKASDLNLPESSTSLKKPRHEVERITEEDTEEDIEEYTEEEQ
jgi:hypothetical protein